VGKQEIMSPEIICSLDFSFGSFLYIKGKKGTVTLQPFRQPAETALRGGDAGGSEFWFFSVKTRQSRILYICRYLSEMPEIFRELGFVFFFFTNEGNEPIHVHVRKAGGFAKYWIEPVELDFSQGMKVNDLKIAEQLIVEHLGLIKSKWNEVHGF
jgi:hypothetical protein